MEAVDLRWVSTRRHEDLLYTPHIFAVLDHHAVQCLAMPPRICSDMVVAAVWRRCGLETASPASKFSFGRSNSVLRQRYLNTEPG